MPTQHAALSFFQGSDRRLIFTVADIPAGVTFTSATWVLVPGYSDSSGRRIATNGGTAVLTKTLGSGIAVLSVADRVIAVSLSSAETLPLAGNYYDEIAIKLDSGQQDTVSFGDIEVLTRSMGVL